MKKIITIFLLLVSSISLIGCKKIDFSQYAPDSYLEWDGNYVYFDNYKIKTDGSDQEVFFEKLVYNDIEFNVNSISNIMVLDDYFYFIAFSSPNAFPIKYNTLDSTYEVYDCINFNIYYYVKYVSNNTLVIHNYKEIICYDLITKEKKNVYVDSYTSANLNDSNNIMNNYFITEINNEVVCYDLNNSEFDYNVVINDINNADFSFSLVTIDNTSLFQIYESYKTNQGLISNFYLYNPINNEIMFEFKNNKKVNYNYIGNNCYLKIDYKYNDSVHEVDGIEMILFNKTVDNVLECNTVFEINENFSEFKDFNIKDDSAYLYFTSKKRYYKLDSKNLNYKKCTFEEYDVDNDYIIYNNYSYQNKEYYFTRETIYPQPIMGQSYAITFGVKENGEKSALQFYIFSYKEEASIIEQRYNKYFMKDYDFSYIVYNR